MIYSGLVERKVARKLCIRRREYALTSNNQVWARKYRKIIENVVAKLQAEELECERGQALLKLCLSRYFSIIFDQAVKLERPPRLRFTIDSFSSNDCKNFFEFRKEDLSRLLIGLRFPEKNVVWMVAQV